MKTSVYRYYSADNDLLYIGLAANPLLRWQGSRSFDIQTVSRIEIEWFDSRDDAQQAEAMAIIAETPIYNKKIEVLDYDKWLIFASINRQWPFDCGYSKEDRQFILHHIKQGCINRGWLAA